MEKRDHAPKNLKLLDEEFRLKYMNEQHFRTPRIQQIFK